MGIAPWHTDGELVFTATYNGEEIEWDSSGQGLLLFDSLEIQTLKWYVSDITLYRDNKVVGQSDDRYYLIDFSAASSLHIPFHANHPFDAISISLGVDSATQMQGAVGGALDPMYGMYWTWSQRPTFIF